jgi:hypothetical protein
MGVVPIEAKTDFISRGYPYCKTMLYIYCDSCGSFNIKKILSPRQWLLVVIGSLLIVLIVFLTITTGRPIHGKELGNIPWSFLFFFSLIIIIFIFGLWGIPDFQCRKCKNITTKRFNTRNYTSENIEIDVPKDSIQKYYLSYWPDMCDLNEYLKVPKGSGKTGNKN